MAVGNLTEQERENRVKTEQNREQPRNGDGAMETANETKSKSETKAEARQRKRSKKAEALKDRVIKAANKIYPVMENLGFDWDGDRRFDCQPHAYEDDKGWHVGKDVDLDVTFKAKLDAHGNLYRQLHCELRNFTTDLIRATDAIEELCDRQDRKAEAKKNGSASECEPVDTKDAEENSAAVASSTSSDNASSYEDREEELERHKQRVAYENTLDAVVASIEGSVGGSLGTNRFIELAPAGHNGRHDDAPTKVHLSASFGSDAISAGDPIFGIRKDIPQQVATHLREYATWLNKAADSIELKCC